MLLAIGIVLGISPELTRNRLASAHILAGNAAVNPVGNQAEIKNRASLKLAQVHPIAHVQGCLEPIALLRQRSDFGKSR